MNDDSVDRSSRVEEVVAELRAWADGRADVQAVALVGSYAREPGAATAESDVDIVVVTSKISDYLESTDGFPATLELPLLRAEQWGSVHERRLRHRRTGLVVELNFTTPDWAATAPEVDSGTRKVVLDGIRVLRDPHGLLARLIDACSAEAAEGR
ncbi:nucleotidyltransferase domain-containing protein [Saccharopolyspora sp. NPDC050389]|uniref:nucleotidyltransferase domain-containing protein n=1 Tax=Saccharopolyspora sp. NPDC050389 TaxID=3155516 RepID=UPI0033C2F98E